MAAVVALGLLGCGGDDNPSGGDNNGSNNNNNNSGGVSVVGKWMTENLNVETSDSWCYENDPANCAKYGRLYTWEAAKSACQQVGMRLPTREEWNALVDAAGGQITAGSKLKSTSGWNNNGNGTGWMGFSALPGGYRASGGYFVTAGHHGYWWTATEDSGGDAYYRNKGYNYDDVDEYDGDKSYAFSARCVQD